MSLSRTELRTWLQLIGGIKALLDALDAELRSDAGMSHDDYQILSRLHRGPDRSMRMGDLAREMGFSPSRLSHAVTRLEGQGWVRRRPGEADRRVVAVMLTETGKAHAREASEGHFDLVRSLVFDTLGPDKARDTAGAFDLIRRATAVESP